MKSEPITTNEMRLADTVIRLDQSGYPDLLAGPLTVKQIKDGLVHLFRIYTSTADFSYTGGVICYIGYEDFRVSADDNQDHWLLLARKELK